MDILDKLYSFFTPYELDLSKDIACLENIIIAFDSPKDYAKQFSFDEPESGIVEQLYNRKGQHRCNGLLISENGYFLTAKHCIDGNIRKNKLKLSDGSIWPIDRVCAIGKKEDIALAKANVRSESKPIIYNPFEFNKTTSIPIGIITRWQGNVERNFGMLDYRYVSPLQSSGHYERSVPIQAKTKPGDSGGLVLDCADHKLMGFLSTGNSGNYSTMSRYSSGIDVIRIYVDYLKNTRI